ncbi:DUF4406 domain-containing protein [Prevotella sp. E13-17]|uniref:DUF4406 domain-containing protein n=1 Tax=Prevotella sp. E13-17 TaxID=2913616 RepID=UPI001ED9CB7F|nr:DUF4406 domain-containing protein [Prevotella sp. E13-17]UKK52112.1 DUF4406 domain-containing protein [Prevotella sp. E13-17]
MSSNGVFESRCFPVTEENERKQRVYISGPISGHNPDEQREKFKIVQERLEFLGFETFNPMENGLPPESSTADHMRRDLSTLCREEDPFDIIYMMQGWTHSKGCKTEFDCATAIGLRVIFEDVVMELATRENVGYVPTKFK